MRWSWRVMRVFDIDIRIHATFAVILVLGALGWSSFGLAGAAFGGLLMALLFTCVALHELGHSLVAQRLGVPVRDIILSPLGGVATMTKRPSKPSHELWIALAGPAVNVVLAVVLTALIVGMYGTGALSGVSFSVSGLTAPSVETLLLWLLSGNIMLAVFNMIPAFPLDGGRVLRAALSMRGDSVRATRIAATMGQVFAGLLAGFGMFVGNVFLIAIAAFIFLAARGEYQAEQLRAALRHVRAIDVARRPEIWLSPATPVGAVSPLGMRFGDARIPVLERRHGTSALVGVIRPTDAWKAAAHLGPYATVLDVMDQRIASVDGRQDLTAVEELLAGDRAAAVAVYEHGTLMGFLTTTDLVRAARYAKLRKPPSARQAGLPDAAARLSS